METLKEYTSGLFVPIKKYIYIDSPSQTTYKQAETVFTKDSREKYVSEY